MKMKRKRHMSLGINKNLSSLPSLQASEATVITYNKGIINFITKY